MKVHEASKAKKLSNKEFLEIYGEEHNLKSHLSKLPKELEEELFGEEKKIETTEPESTETVDSAETIVVGGQDEGKDDCIQDSVDDDSEGSVKSDDGVERVLPDSSEHVQELGECPYTNQEIRIGCKGCGNKSPMWKWRHILDA